MRTWDADSRFGPDVCGLRVFLVKINTYRNFSILQFSLRTASDTAELLRETKRSRMFVSRLPIVQGATFSFLSPAFSILSLPKWKCPGE